MQQFLYKQSTLLSVVGFIEISSSFDHFYGKKSPQNVTQKIYYSFGQIEADQICMLIRKHILSRGAQICNQPHQCYILFYDTTLECGPVSIVCIMLEKYSISSNWWRDLTKLTNVLAKTGDVTSQYKQESDIKSSRAILFCFYLVIVVRRATSQSKATLIETKLEIC